MPGIMFENVVCPRGRSNRKWYTLPLSCLVHASILAVIVVVPLIATDVVPAPRSVMEFTTPFVPAMPTPTPVPRARTGAIAHSDPGPPLVAPDTIGVESGVVFQPGDVETTGIDSIISGFDAGSVGVDAPPASVVVAPQVPVVVGGNIKAPTRIKYVAPAYPDLAQKAHVQGVVIIEAVIGVDGRVEQARILRSQPLLDDAALTAVRAWEYTPTLLNGRPTAVVMTVTVVFRLE